MASFRAKAGMRVVLFEISPVAALAWTFLVGLGVGPAFAALPPLSLEPPQVVAGSFTVLRAPGIRAGARVAAFGLSFLSFPDESGAVRALIPVPMATRSGRFPIRIAGRTAWLEVKRRPVRRVESLPSLTMTAKVVTALASAKDVVKPALRTVTPRSCWGPALRRPVQGRISSGFGSSRSYDGSAGMHWGTDFAAPKGWPVVAVAGGRVLVAGFFAAYGNAVVIDHGQTFCTVSMHMTHLEVRAGDRVAEGQVIGEVGALGIATGPHLHLGAYLAGVPIDAEDLLARGLP